MSTRDTRSFQNTLALGLPITRPLQKGRIGSFYFTGPVTVNATDTALAHELGRTPSGYIVVRNQSGGVVQDGANLGSDWTPSSIVLKATVAGTYSLLLC